MKRIIASLLILSISISGCYSVYEVPFENYKSSVGYEFEDQDRIRYVVLTDGERIDFNNNCGLYHKTANVVVGEDNENTIHIIDPEDIIVVGRDEVSTFKTTLFVIGATAAGILIFLIYATNDSLKHNKGFIYVNN
jgi:hypothetical protein